MRNIHDLQNRVFSDSKDIISFLSQINDIEELVDRHDLITKLAEKTSFLKALKKNIEEYNMPEIGFSENTLLSDSLVTEEEAIFNQALNEVGEGYDIDSTETLPVKEQEDLFDQQIQEIEESDFHETKVILADQSQPLENTDFVSDEISDHFELEEEAAFNNQLNEIDDETGDNDVEVLNFVDEELILHNSAPEDDLFTEDLYSSAQTTVEQIDELSVQNELAQIVHSTQDIDDNVHIDEDLLIEEREFISNEYNGNQDEIITENSNIQGVLNELKHDTESKSYQESSNETSESTVATDNTNENAEEKEEEQLLKSDENFENLDAYHEAKKIKLAHIRGLKSVQSLFDDDPLERATSELPNEDYTASEEQISSKKTVITTDFMEAHKSRPEFRLDLNDRIAFTKVLFSGSQADLNEAMSELNRCRNLNEAKEFLSDLYYEKNWEKVDDYAQRLWILVENKFL